MKKIVKLVLSICLLFCFDKVYSQAHYVPVEKGENLPEMPYHQVLNYEKDSLRLSDFKGKLLILDFWNTYCIACLGSFPKLQQLQEQFKDKVQIMLVVNHKGASKQDYIDFYNMRKARGIPISLPSIVNDSILIKLFPHVGLPYIVWIDEIGKVKSLTSGNQLTEENILNILKDSNFTPKSRTQQDREFVAYTDSIPLFVNGNGGDGKDFMSQSIFIKNSKARMGGNLKIFRDSTHTRLNLMNMFFPYLFTTAINRRYPQEFNWTSGKYLFASRFLSKGHVIESTSELLIKDLETLESREGKNDNTDLYSYELMLQGNKTDNEMLDAMLADLYNQFKVQLKIQRKKIRYFDLKMIDSGKLIKSTYPKSYVNSVSKEDSIKVILTKQNLVTITQMLNRHLDVPFIWCEYPYSQNLYDMDFDLKNRLDLKGLKRDLRKYGLILKKRNKYQDIMVFTD